MSFLLSYYPILSVVPVAANDLPQEGPYRLGDLQVLRRGEVSSVCLHNGHSPRPSPRPLPMLGPSERRSIINATPPKLAKDPALKRRVWRGSWNFQWIWLAARASI